MTLFNLRQNLNSRGGRSPKPQRERNPTSMRSGKPYLERRDKAEIAALKAQLADKNRIIISLISDRDELQDQKDEHQQEFPNGCIDAKSAPKGNTVCPGTGRWDHSEHSIQCFSV